jgi:DNA-binding transcriptional MerR regulator
MNTDSSPPAPSYPLAELCVLADLPPRTVRYYVQIGLVDRPQGETRAARYGATQLEQLLLIKKWTAAGLSLERIRELLHGELGPGAPAGAGHGVGRGAQPPDGGRRHGPGDRALARWTVSRAGAPVHPGVMAVFCPSQRRRAGQRPTQIRTEPRKGKSMDRSVRCARLETRDGHSVPCWASRSRATLRGLMFEASVEQRFCQPDRPPSGDGLQLPLALGRGLAGRGGCAGGANASRCAVVGKTQAEARYEEALAEGNAAIMLEKQPRSQLQPEPGQPGRR